MTLNSSWREGALSKLNVAIDALNLAKEVSSVTPAKAVFGSVSVLLTMLRDSMANEQDYVELGLNCAALCQALDRGVNGKRSNELNESVLEAIKQLTTTVVAIQKKVVKKGKRNAISRFFHAKSDKDTVATWKQDLTRVLHIFNTELAINTHILVADIHRNVMIGQEGEHQSSKACVPLGELPPPPPRNCFGRDQLIEKLVNFAENLEPVALIGAGGIGKTSIALTVLHDNRIKDRFGENRRFIRCDQFPASRTHFLARLSRVIGAGVENPDDLIPLRPFLSSQEILIVLDNAESVLDPQGTDSQEIYGIVNELCLFRTLCICITSRLTTVPRHCKHLEIPTLSIEAARDVFYSIHGDGGQSGIIDDLLRRLDFHALSITLLATTASHNVWDYDELAKEWHMHRAKALRTDYNESLAATIELSLASPTFRKLGADARELLGLIAFFPQGVNERDSDSFLPNIPDRKNIFNKFRALSLTHRSDGFITMLAPIRDYLCPQDPKSSSLLCEVKDCYFSCLSVNVDPYEPGFEEVGQWIKGEDTNIEHLLNVFMNTSPGDPDVWVACEHFIRHLFWHNKRQTILGQKIIDLPDDYPSKPSCLLNLSHLFGSMGNNAEQKRVLSYALRIFRERGNDLEIAVTLASLSQTNRALEAYEEETIFGGLDHTDTNRVLQLYEKGACDRILELQDEATLQAKEASEIFERLGSAEGLALVLHSDNQLDAAEEAASRAIKLVPEKGQEFQVCHSHLLLGQIYLSKGEKEKAMPHLHKVLAYAAVYNCRSEAFSVLKILAQLSCDEDNFDDAQVYIDLAKLHGDAFEGTYNLGLAMMMQASIWFRQSRLEDARSETLEAIEIFEKLGAAGDVGASKKTLRDIEKAMKPKQ